jgi:hypothetical protein
LFVKLKREIDPVSSVDAIDVRISAVSVDIDNPSVRGTDVFTIVISSFGFMMLVNRGMNPILINVGI